MKKNFYSSDNNLKNLSDEELLLAIDNNNEAMQVLMERYTNLVNIKVSKYFLIGAEREDVFQEGMIGLFKAIQNFKHDKDNTFKTFANLCIERQLITAVKTCNRQKHIPLNSSLSFDTTAYEDEGNSNTTFLDLFNDKSAVDPLDSLTKKEYYSYVEEKMDEHLSTFEKDVLNNFLLGHSYVDIAEKLDSPVKSVDNAIQRIRKKAYKNITDEKNY